MFNIFLKKKKMILRKFDNFVTFYFPSNFVLTGRIVQIIIPSGAQQQKREKKSADRSIGKHAFGSVCI